MAPWKSGRLLVWDTTCPDTFAPSYRAHATVEPGRVAAIAEDRKDEKYRDLPSTHWFCPIAIETMGAVGPRCAESLLRQVRPSRQNTSCRDCPLLSRGETVPQFWGACKPDTIFFFTVISSQAIFISHITFSFLLCWQSRLVTHLPITYYIIVSG